MANSAVVEEETDLERHYQQYQRELCRYAVQKFGLAYSEAEDIVQIAFTKLAVHQRTSVEIIENIRAFLYRSVHNACIDQARRRSVRENYITSQQAQGDLDVDFRSPERVALSHQFLNMINGALWAMPGKRRKLLLMNRIEGLSYAEIARREGLSETVVRKHVFKALADCQKAVRPKVDRSAGDSNQ